MILLSEALDNDLFRLTLSILESTMFDLYLINFKKNEEDVNPDDFFRLSPRLRIILCDLALYCWKNFRKKIVITSMFRDSGIHSTGRAADIRSRIFKNSQCRKITNYLNKKYKYGLGYDGKEHDTCIWHDVGKGKHFHIQVKK